MTEKEGMKKELAMVQWQKMVLINEINQKWVEIGSKKKDGSFAAMWTDQNKRKICKT